MKILVVGGSGLIGGHAALHLRHLGHEVAIASRRAPPGASALAALPHIAGDYLAGDFDSRLAGFEGLVFCAGADIRHVAKGDDADALFQRANVEAVPRFFSAARAAGVRRAVHVGSFYPQVRPDLVASSNYVRSRHLADRGACALAREDFRVCSVNAPFVVGAVPGLPGPMSDYYTRYALGQLGPVPVFAPAGGVNFISTQSLSEAIAGALERAAPGHSYLVGDENLSFGDYFSEVFRAAGRDMKVPILDQEHPLLPDRILYAGRGTFTYYEPDPAETALLLYRRGDVRRAIAEATEQSLRQLAATG